MDLIVCDCACGAIGSLRMYKSSCELRAGVSTQMSGIDMSGSLLEFMDFILLGIPF